MQSSAVILSLMAVVSATTCTMAKPAVRAPIKASPAYNTGSISALPAPIVCTDIDSPLSEPEQVSCAASAINAIDEQIAYLVANRLEYAAIYKVAATIQGSPASVPAAALGAKVAYYGASSAAGDVVGAALSSATASAEADAVKKMCK